MTSFKRVFFYSSQLPQETRLVALTPPREWPSQGVVEFQGVTFRYRPGLPYVLRNVSFLVGAGEKIGVCGRTGSGKSSILHALFRLVELDPALAPVMIDPATGMPQTGNADESPNGGRVLIDGVDISKVELQRVRRSIAIVPQDPTLFTGSIRSNLDIAGVRTDDEIWETLRLIDMKESIQAFPMLLDTPVEEGGMNFSCGQRQLLCFGRAILNRCQIVVLDEATASVDVETESKIQHLIRKAFKEKTMIVIAHRLNTILGSDRILVMDDGHVVEFDTPTVLMGNPDSAFNALLHNLSK
jgi:ATP-binding cassette subfamily C (CFTR/MRP) protein 5